MLLSLPGSEPVQWVGFLEQYCGQYAHVPLVICSLFSAAVKAASCFPVGQYCDCSLTEVVTCAESTNKE